ncbi:ribosome maturation factor RimP [Candidatus Thioglobus sp.]|jgi:ribosome maturation factor RimP|uniref:ribosome maturation factor RimP n=1 Tax=Candidatus Thioglobus sp. TaxID=2026721 RepID=UPI001EB47884|nr:ribosome maturation factor RimP [Candidatus Thioglobus sp.]MBT3186600.1 ribosome maturation factor RimP [Candidatus Thioglobus sp.]MBT4315767.1 ribosome maturation factor RimP [Candidatus Thioglobus sp.]MBT5286854.1 ribosome maturation factor RimP [Candidatus Thioglobus sp.]MBT6328004.1 ribosome maturation factor RimP [Candidatus Thioglobus sp.]
MAKIADKIEELINPVIADMGYELVGIDYIASGKHSTVRVYIDSDKGIGLDDCEVVSRQISAIFDVEDPVSGQYNLEVSSPGIERPLFHIGHYQRFLGHDVKLRLLRPMNGQRKFNGAIGSVSEVNNSVELVTELGPVTLDIDMIEKANLIAHF